MALGQWLRRRFVTGLFVAVPLLVSVSALVGLFGYEELETFVKESSELPEMA